MDSPTEAHSEAPRQRVGRPGKEQREAAAKRCRERDAQDWPGGLETEVERLWEEIRRVREFHEVKEALLLQRLDHAEEQNRKLEEQNRLLAERVEALAGGGGAQQ